MALLECRKTGGGNQDLAIYGNLIYVNTIAYDEYDVSNINEVIIKNVSSSSSSANRKLYVYLDNTLSYTLLVGYTQTIDVSNVNTLKISLSNTNTIVGYCLIMKNAKRLTGSFYEDYYSISQSDVVIGHMFDVSNFKAFSLKNTGDTSGAEYRNIIIYLDNSFNYNNLITVGDTLTLNIENNHLVRIVANNTNAWIRYNLTLS